MSDLVKGLKKTTLLDSSVTTRSPIPEEDQKDDSSSASSVSSAGTARPNSSQRLKSSPTPSSLLWRNYFSEELYLRGALPDGRLANYHVYVSGAITEEAILVVCHHGAGSSGLSFALFARELQSALPKACVISIEARGHGSTVLDKAKAADTNFSIDELSLDLINMINLSLTHYKVRNCPPLVLVGHSLGGAVVTNVVHMKTFGTKVLGFAVLDVVEGSALEALKTMRNYLVGRPEAFPSVEDAVNWHIRSRTLRNPNSAKVSVPSLLRATPNEEWRWRTQLAETETFWEDWFKGMSKKFLGSRGAKLLLLAGTDRLDKELMIGQMQGVFSYLLLSDNCFLSMSLQSLVFADYSKENSNCKFFRLQVISSTRICQTKLQKLSLNLSKEMTEVHWFCLLKCLICLSKVKRYSRG